MENNPKDGRINGGGSEHANTMLYTREHYVNTREHYVNTREHYVTHTWTLCYTHVRMKQQTSQRWDWNILVIRYYSHLKGRSTLFFI